MEELNGQKVLVLGLGVSGRSAANYCAQQGARVVAAEERAIEEIEGIDAVDASVSLATGATFPDSADFDLVVPSPGVPAERYREGARRVWGDVELAYRALAVPIIAVTGTNGKSTTTLLIEAMLRAAGFRARAAGNIGTPALSLVGEALDFAVLEVSSFQLESVESFRPAVAVVLNITPDHLDRHGSLAEYTASKSRIVSGQTADDVAVLNFDDARVRTFARETAARVYPYRCAGHSPGGAWLDSGAAALSLSDGSTLRISLDGMRLVGAHNVENALAALAAVAAAGVDPSLAATALASFSGLPHRSEVVARRAGVTWINDSKATNTGATVRALTGVGEPVVWIGGGRDKGLDFSELARVAGERVRAAVLIGEAAEKIASALPDGVPVHRETSIEAAVRTAAELAETGDVVLLAPACASHDQFADYAERGDRFRRAVNQLDEEGART